MGGDTDSGLIGAGIGGAVGMFLGGEVEAVSGALLGGLAEDYFRARYDVDGVRNTVYETAETYTADAHAFFR